MPKINKIEAREILDSRGLPTVEVDVTLSDGSLGRAAVPSGASTGTHEALELRDGDGSRYGGKGVSRAVSNVRGALGKELVGKSFADPKDLDRTMLKFDGTPAKSRLGANAILGVSMAFCRAAAQAAKLPLYEYLRKVYEPKARGWVLPTPMMNIINGGVHADSGLDIQEFMIVPVGAASFKESVRMGSEVYHALKGILKEGGHSTSVGDEGGFAPRLPTHEEALQTTVEAVRKAGYDPSSCALAVDSAATEFYRSERYMFQKGVLTAEEMTTLYTDWVRKYPIVSLEDPLAEDDWDGWKAITRRLNSEVRLVGDDLFVTNPERLDRGIRSGTANAILIKLNQIGTVTETVRTVEAAHAAQYAVIISHRSGETEDPFIADLAVAVGACAIKTGAPCRSERLAKYNQLLRIEDGLGRKAAYAGRSGFERAVPHEVRVRA